MKAKLDVAVKAKKGNERAVKGDEEGAENVCAQMEKGN